MNKIRKGDKVILNTGKDKGKQGIVLNILKNNRVVVEGLNMVKKHTKPNPNAGIEGGIIEKEMPIEIEEAAAVDGASIWMTLRRIVFPLLGPGMAAVGVLTFLFSWSDYLFAVVLTSSEATPVTVGAANFVTSYGVRWGDISAAVCLSVLPPLVFATAAQKFLVKGLSSGAVKG